MIGVVLFYPTAHGLHPFEENRAAVSRVASWFVRKLPGENRRLVFVKSPGYGVPACEDLADVDLVGLANLRIAIEFVTRSSLKPGNISIHAAEIGPVVY